MATSEIYLTPGLRESYALTDEEYSELTADKSVEECNAMFSALEALRQHIGEETLPASLRNPVGMFKGETLYDSLKERPIRTSETLISEISIDLL